MIKSTAVILEPTSFGEALATISFKVEVQVPRISMVTKEMTRSLQDLMVPTSQSDSARATIRSVVALAGPVPST